MGFEEMVRMIAQRIAFDVSREEIRAAILAAGATDETFFLAWVGAKMILATHEGV